MITTNYRLMRFYRFKAKISKVKHAPIIGVTNFFDPNRNDVSTLFEFSKNRIFFTDKQIAGKLTLETSSQYATSTFENGMKYTFDKVYNEHDKKIFQITVGNQGFSSPLQINWYNKILCNCVHGRYLINQEWFYKTLVTAAIGFLFAIIGIVIGYYLRK